MHSEVSTIQKRAKLNTLLRLGAPGPGGAYHEYAINIDNDPNDRQDVILFQKGPRNVESSKHGVIDSDLIEIVLDRMKKFNEGEYACKENAMVITSLETALLWMNKRVEDRIERDVLGTYDK